MSNKISILIPVYEMRGQGKKFLKHNLDSIARQDYRNYEIIISDNSANADIENFCKTHELIDRIRHYRNPEKIGISANYNYGLKFCTGDIIKPVFQDDFLDTANCLTELNAFAELNPNSYWFVFTCFRYVEDGRTNIFNPSWNLDILRGNNTISAPSVIAYKNQFADNVQMDENLTLYCDIDFYYRFYLRYGLPFFITTALIGIRDWEGNTAKHLGMQGLVEKKYFNSKHGI